MSDDAVRSRIEFIASLNIASELRESLIGKEIARRDSEPAPLPKTVKLRQEKPANVSDCPQVEEEVYPFLSLGDIVRRNSLPRESLNLGKGVSAEYVRVSGEQPIRGSRGGINLYPAEHEKLLVQIVKYLLRPRHVTLSPSLLDLLNAFADYGKEATEKEVADTRPAVLRNITSQVTQLRRGGYLGVVGKRRAIATGNAANVYRVTLDGWAALAKAAEMGDAQ